MVKVFFLLLFLTDTYAQRHIPNRALRPIFRYSTVLGTLKVGFLNGINYYASMAIFRASRSNLRLMQSMPKKFTSQATVGSFLMSLLLFNESCHFFNKSQVFPIARKTDDSFLYEKILYRIEDDWRRQDS